jgi:hypothetical protein
MVDQVLPNGNILKDVPEDATKAQMIEKSISLGLATAEDFGMDMSSLERGPGIKQKAKEAMAKVPRSPFVHLGRGFQNLAHGAEQMMFPWETIYPQRLEEIERERTIADDPYQQLAEREPGAAVIGQLVGETAPFLNMPVGRVPGAFATGGLLKSPANVAARTAPEAAAGAVEAAVPYAETPEERRERMLGGAVGSVLAKTGTDYFAKRANIRRGRMADEGLQEMHDLGTQEGIPVRQGGIEEQMGAAEAAAEKRTTGRGQGEIAEDVLADFQAGMSSREADFGLEYERLLDRITEASPQMNVTPIQVKAQRLLDRETAKGGHANESLMTEYRKWLDTPTGDMRALREFRSGMRDRMRALGPEDRKAAAALEEFEDFISDEMARQADNAMEGGGQMLSSLDKYFYEDLARIRRMPGAKAALGENPTPQALVNFLKSKPGPNKRKILEVMSPEGRQAVAEAGWNEAYDKATRGAEFNPKRYATWIRDNAESMQDIMPGEDHAAMVNLGKLMDHIAGEGRNPDTSIINVIRGFPFMYRAIGDRFRKSNFKYMLANVSPDIRPGSPEMERFYRGVIRSLAIQEEKGPILEEISRPPRAAMDAADAALGRLM